jgi:hypothetical protein
MVKGVEIISETRDFLGGPRGNVSSENIRIVIGDIDKDGRVLDDQVDLSGRFAIPGSRPLLNGVQMDAEATRRMGVVELPKDEVTIMFGGSQLEGVKINLNLGCGPSKIGAERRGDHVQQTFETDLVRIPSDKIIEQLRKKANQIEHHLGGRVDNNHMAIILTALSEVYAVNGMDAHAAEARKQADLLLPERRREEPLVALALRDQSPENLAAARSHVKDLIEKRVEGYEYKQSTTPIVGHAATVTIRLEKPITIEDNAAGRTTFTNAVLAFMENKGFDVKPGAADKPGIGIGTVSVVTEESERSIVNPYIINTVTKIRVSVALPNIDDQRVESAEGVVARLNNQLRDTARLAERTNGKQ